MGVLIDAAAVWRIARLVTQDEITRPAREAVNERWPDSPLAYWFECPHCVSLWAGLAVATGLVPPKLRYALALAAATTAVVNSTSYVQSVVSEAVVTRGVRKA
jgi:hypothetical protein